MQPALLTGIMLKKAKWMMTKEGPDLSQALPLLDRAQSHMFDEQLSQPIRIFQTLLELLQEIAGRVERERKREPQTLRAPFFTYQRVSVMCPSHSLYKTPRGSLSQGGPMVPTENLG